jgi:hypothetical protein
MLPVATSLTVAETGKSGLELRCQTSLSRKTGENSRNVNDDGTLGPPAVSHAREGVEPCFVAVVF